MRAALALLFLAGRAIAHEGGTSITFKGLPAGQVAIGLSSPGNNLWDSGSSDPIPTAFSWILFQGFSADPNSSLEAALQSDGSRQTWIPGEIERFPNGRFWGKFAIAAEKGATVRVRVVSRGIVTKRAVDLFSLEAVVPENETRGASILRAPLPAPRPTPMVLARRKWGARPATRPYEPMIPARISIHHTEAAQPMSFEDAVQEMQAIQNYHQKGHGWIDIGYHFVIDGSGRIFQGRPETAVGAHVLNKNTGNVGISLMGSFQKPRDQHPTASQLKSAIALSRWLVSAYGLDPNAIKGHRDQEATDCPGQNLYVLLDGIRNAVKAPSPLGIRAPKIFNLPLLPNGGLEAGAQKSMFDSRSR